MGLLQLFAGDLVLVAVAVLLFLAWIMTGAFAYDLTSFGELVALAAIGGLVWLAAWFVVVAFRGR